MTHSVALQTISQCLLIKCFSFHNSGSDPKTTDQILNGALKNLEETLIDSDKKKMAHYLMVKLELVENESSSDEESAEHKNLMFEDAASSAGSKSTVLLTRLVIHVV